MVRSHDFTSVRIARDFSKRLNGLIGADDLHLFIPNCRAVHTWFMRAPIDIIFINAMSMVVRIAERAKPWRVFLGPSGTRSVLELPAGAARKQNVHVGDMIVTRYK